MYNDEQTRRKYDQQVIGKNGSNNDGIIDGIFNWL